MPIDTDTTGLPGNPDVPEAAPKPAEPAPGPSSDHHGPFASAEDGGAPVRRTSDRRVAANRANGQKSTGPRTALGKERSSMNGLKRRSVRLLGLFEAKTLRQEPGAAEQLYRELIKPYQPLPPLLAMHFQDLARLHLELETSECIRDATLEHRWQQADIEKRRKFYEMESDLPATPKEVFEGGICRIEASAAKFKKQAHYLGLLREQLERRNFDLGNVLQLLYGKDFDPEHDRGQTICSRCRKLMSGEWQLPSEQQEGNIDEEQLEGLLDLVALEEDDALTGYRLKLDEKTVTRAACIAALAPTSDDRLMELQAERLRRAIDRKQWVINGLLQTLRPAEAAKPDANPGPGPEHPLPPHKKSGKRSQEVICNQQNDAKTHEIRTEPKPTEPNSAADKPFETSHRSVAVRSITHRSAPLPTRPRIQAIAALPPSHFRVSPPRLVRLPIHALAAPHPGARSGRARLCRRAWTAGPPPVNQTLAPALYRSEPEKGRPEASRPARRHGAWGNREGTETMRQNLKNSRTVWTLAGLALAFVWMTGAGVTRTSGFQKPSSAALSTDLGGTASQTEIDTARGAFDHFLDSHPEMENDIFAEPTRITDPNYLHDHQELQVFLDSHPLVKADPRSFVSPQSWRFENRRSDTDDLLGFFVPFAVFVCCLLALLAVMRTVLENRRWNKSFKVHEDVHTKLIEKFSSGQELTAYMESEAGRRLLEWTPPVVETRAPLAAGRILWSLQTGLILGLAGLGLLAIRSRISSDAADGMLICGTLGLTIGLGFFCSAFLSYGISKHLGLIGGGTQGDSRLAQAGR